MTVEVVFFKKPFLFLSLLVFVLSCTFTSIRPKKPDFNTDTDIIAKDIKGLVNHQEISLTGSQSKTNEKAISELAITITNPQNLPKDQEKFENLSKRIAKILKQALRDPNEYDMYKVEFLFEQSNGIVTNSKSYDFSFKSSDL